ncbi:unnamed protein product, partial [Brassica oleracea var. botrytis]
SLPPSPPPRLLPLSSPHHLCCIFFFLLHDVISFHAFIISTEPEDEASRSRRQGGEGAIQIGGEDERIG